MVAGFGGKKRTIRMLIKAKQRLTGAYGTINAGDTAAVLDATGQILIDDGLADEADAPNPTATPEEVVIRNESGQPVEPIHADGINREILNTTGRVLNESGPALTEQTAARAEAEVEPLILGTTDEKEDKATSVRKTKEDKAAA